MIGLYQEPGWETVTALFLPETTDSLFLRLRPSAYPTIKLDCLQGSSGALGSRRR